MTTEVDKVQQDPIDDATDDAVMSEERAAEGVGAEATNFILATSNKVACSPKKARKHAGDRRYMGKIAKAKFEFVRVDEVERAVKEALHGTLGPDVAHILLTKMNTTFKVPVFDPKEGDGDASAARKLHRFVARWHPSKLAIVRSALGALAHANELLEDGRPLLITGAGPLEKLCTRRIADWLLAKDEAAHNSELSEAQRESPTNKRLAIASSINDALKFVRLRACELKGEKDAVIEGHTTDQALYGWKATRGSGLVFDNPNGKAFVERAIEEGIERCATK